MPSNMDLIRNELQKIFTAAQQRGAASIEVVSKRLHDTTPFVAGSHPNQMPSVCNVMHENRGAGDVVMHETPSGKSSTLRILYRLPRPSAVR